MLSIRLNSHEDGHKAGDILKRFFSSKNFSTGQSHKTGTSIHRTVLVIVVFISFFQLKNYAHLEATTYETFNY